MYLIITYQMKSGGPHKTIFPDTPAAAKKKFDELKKDKRVYFVVLSKELEKAHP